VRGLYRREPRLSYDTQSFSFSGNQVPVSYRGSMIKNFENVLSVWWNGEPFCILRFVVFDCQRSDRVPSLLAV